MYQNGLPKGVGTWYVRAAALCKTEQGGAITKTYYPYGQATQIVIEKGTPVYEVPTGLTATYGQTLADIALPVNWEWENAEQSVGNAGTRTAFAVFTPADTENYNSVRVQIAYSVEKAHYDMSGVKFEDAEYTYDGQEKKLEIEGVLPAGVSVA